MAKRTKSSKPQSPGVDTPKGGVDAFISHSSKDKHLATQLEECLQAAGFTVWIDHANLRAGGLLLDALQDALSRSANLVLLWSKPASESRYVSAEWQAAFHLQKGIIPCLLDETPLPPFLLRLLFGNFRVSFDTGLSQLVGALGGQPTAPLEPRPSARRTPGKKRADIAQDIHSRQNQVLAYLQDDQPEVAAQFQALLDPLVDTAVQANTDDSLILNLTGYHKKNAYMIHHWADIQAQQYPKDPVLEEAERLFFAALSLQPDDPSALNGLGSILILRRDLDAAEFFVRRALARSQEENLPYAAAEHDLRLIQRLKRERQRL